MDEASLHELLSGHRRDVGAMLLRSGLSLAACGYGTAMALRNFAYDRRCLSITQLDVPVISIGNITTGGTGKTPLAAWLANWLVNEGHSPGLLSRGYHSLDGAENDEKRVLDRACPGVPHVQQRDRIAGAHRLTSEHHCDVLILDDGFQHRRLKRDLDLMLIDALQPWGYNRLLPRGLLRESLSSLRRADIVLMTRADCATNDQRDAIRRELIRWRDADVCVEVGFTPQRLIGLNGEVQPLNAIASQKPVAFCGIGSPKGFQKTLSNLNASCDLKVYPDHHHYSQSDLADIAFMANAASADIVLTTLKDLVKIVPQQWNGPPILAIDIGVEFLSNASLLDEALAGLFASQQ